MPVKPDMQEGLLATDRCADVQEVTLARQFSLRKPLLLAFAALIGTVFMIGVWKPKLHTVRIDELASENVGWGTSSCYKYTGGTCFVQKCLPERNATCSEGRCWCKSGCVGSDGLCRPSMTEYKVIAKKFKLRNLKFREQYMYAPRAQFMEQMRSASKRLYPQYSYNWNLYELPGKMWVPPGTYNVSETAGYYLSPTDFPEFAAGIYTSKLSVHVPFSGKTLDPEIHNPDGGISFSLGSKFVVDLYHLSRRYMFAEFEPFNPELPLNSLCRPIGYPDAIQIRGGFGQASWYSHYGSWEVFGWVRGNPGHGGFWVPEPQINISLPLCPQDPLE